MDVFGDEYAGEYEYMYAADGRTREYVRKIKLPLYTKQGIFRLGESDDIEINRIAAGFNRIPQTTQHLIWSFYCNHYNARQTKRVQHYSDDSSLTIYERGAYYDDKREGVWRLWNNLSDHRLVEDTTYHLGVLHGDAKDYYSGSGAFVGKIRSHHTYKNGKEHGNWTLWHLNGQIAQIFTHNPSSDGIGWTGCCTCECWDIYGNPIAIDGFYAYFRVENDRLSKINDVY